MTDKKTSDDFTLILKLKKSLSSNNLTLYIALSTIASGHGSLYFSKIDLSKDPALTPILIEQPKSFAALMTSIILFLSPIFPGFILRQSAPLLAASIALW